MSCVRGPTKFQEAGLQVVFISLKIQECMMWSLAPELLVSAALEDLRRWSLERIYLILK